MGEKRTRNWGTIIYPPNGVDETTCPENWADILGSLGVRAVASPVHDKDIAANGEYKKPHRHVLIAYDGVKSAAQVREIVDKIGGVGVEPINSLYAQVRYLTHMDNPEKAQYSTLDVLTFGGFEYKRYASTKEDEERATSGCMAEIMNASIEYGIYDFAGMADYLMAERPELFATFRKNSYFFATYLKCKRNITLKPLDKQGGDFY